MRVTTASIPQRQYEANDHESEEDAIYERPWWCASTDKRNEVENQLCGQKLQRQELIRTE